MDKTYAFVENGIVSNVVIADSDWIAAQDGTWIEYTNESPAAIGWLYDGKRNVFIAPLELPPEE